MKHISVSGVLVSVAILLFVASTWASGMDRKVETNVKQGVVKAWRLGNTNYCHLKFPPITKRTLFSDSPKLAPEWGTLIDYYGPCNHDPLGEAEIEKQQNVHQRLNEGE